MPYHRLARLAPPRLLVTGALTLASALGVGSLQGSAEDDAVYSAATAGGLTRLSADTVAARNEAAGEAARSAGETDIRSRLRTRADAGDKGARQQTRPKIKRAENAGAPEASSQASDAPVVVESPPPPPPPPPVAVDPVWTSLAACESGGNWQINTGNGYYGGLQFSVDSWQGVGGQGYPHEHPREVQIEMAERLQQLQGWNAWPVCARRLGLI